MPRYPDPKSKHPRIVILAKPEWEVEMRAFKDLCARNGLEMGHEIYVRAIRTFLQDHHWPPGNSQTVLTAFSMKPKNASKCFVCGKESITVLVSGRGVKKHFCSKHMQEALDSGKWERIEEGSSGEALP